MHEAQARSGRSPLPPCSPSRRAVAGAVAPRQGRRSRSGRPCRARARTRPRRTRSSTPSTWRSKRSGGVVGGYTIVYKDVDDSTAAAGKWDEATEIKNANDAVANDSRRGLHRHVQLRRGEAVDPDPLRQGHRHDQPGQHLPGPDQGRQGRAGRAGRVLPERLHAELHPRRRRGRPPGRAGALWASQLGVKKVYVLDDTELYGKGIADVFAAEGRRASASTILGRDGIDGKATDYKALAEKIKATSPDLVYYGGITQNNAGQLWRDLRDAMPDVKLMGPDGIFEDEWLEAAACRRRGHLHHLRWRPAGSADRRGRRVRHEVHREVPERPGRGATPPTATRRPTSSLPPSSGLRRRTRPTSRRSAPSSSTRSRRPRTTPASLGTWSFDAEGDTSLTDDVGPDRHRRRVQVRQGHQGIVPRHLRIE